MNFDRFKISTRLFALVGALAAMLVAGGVLGVSSIAQSNNALRTVYEDRTVPMGQIGELNALILQNRLEIAGALLYPEEVAQNTARIDANLLKADKAWSAYMATELTPQEASLARQLAEDRARFVSEGLRPTIAALRANDQEGARRIVHEKVRLLYGPVHDGVEALIQLQLGVARGEYDAAMARYNSMRTVSIGATALGILLALAFGLAIVRSIARQLGAEPTDVRLVTAAIASGDLSTRIAVRPGDETSVMAGMAAMQRALVGVVSQVRQGSESVQTASAEIAQGNQDLSARTESQASALEETAASMEQLSAAVHHNADSARQANQLSLNASMVAERGGEIVQMVVDTMKDINASSHKIADIINVIDGIAFQTNILALNAAVEAARAGEQGRGFAVVASEVRSLAGRSADAAKEIKTLIHASVERIEAGSHLVDEAGATMSDVVGAVKRVTDLMGEISAASHEQAAGVAQVGEAVSQMDQVTQQNAALVEEMAAAASSLKSQAQELVQTVAVFQLADAPVAPRPVPVYAEALEPMRAQGHTDSAGINLDNAIQAHAAWRTKLRGAAASGELLDIDCIRRDDCCELGKWIHGPGGAKFGQRPVFVDLLAQHKAFHQEAGKVAQAASHRSPEVEKMLASGSRFSIVSNEVTRLIVQLKRELAGGARALAAPQVRSALPAKAYLGAERRTTEFQSQGDMRAQSEARSVIQSVKQQAKTVVNAPAVRPVPVARAIDTEAWETF